MFKRKEDKKTVHYELFFLSFFVFYICIILFQCLIHPILLNPIKSIYSLISVWIVFHYQEEVLNSLFYKDNGNMYYQEETENGEDVYFDGGDYSDEDSSYYEIPDDGILQK